MISVRFKAASDGILTLTRAEQPNYKSAIATTGVALVGSCMK